MNNEQAFEQGFRDKCAQRGVNANALIKAAGTGQLAKRVLTMSSKALKRLSNSALSTRTSGKTPFYAIGGPGDKMFGVPWSRQSGVVSPTVKQEMLHAIRNALKAAPANPLDAKRPGSVLKKFIDKRDAFPW